MLPQCLCTAVSTKWSAIVVQSNGRRACILCAASLCAQVLTELELPHVYHSVARNSPKRISMREKWDTFQARR